MAVAPNGTPRYPLRRARLRGSLSVANANEDGSGTLVTLYTCPTDVAYAVVRLLAAVARVTTSLGRVKFFLEIAGPTRFKVLDLPVSVVAVAAGTSWSTSQIVGADPVTGAIAVEITLQPGEILKAAPHNAEAIDVTGEVDEY